MLLGNIIPAWSCKKVIVILQAKTSCDFSGQSTKMIKFLSNKISILLSPIFNLGLAQGIFPDKLKNCREIPVYKAGDQLDVDNYRPFSLLSSKHYKH
jgi:hypothetical protein